MKKQLPKYPIYVPSKGRADCCLTAKFLEKDGVPYKLVVEKQERKDYADRFGEDQILVLPFSNKGSVIPCRNWIKDHAAKAGHLRHWQLDDNIGQIRRMYKRKRIVCEAGIALRCTEQFVDRYENVAIAGLNYAMFAYGADAIPPFYLNIRIYSCSLILNSLPNRWRGKYNEDTDLTLQVLADGWCTVLMNAFLIEKKRTMTMKGGNSDELYSKHDGRLKMSRALERLWPGVVKTKRRFDRPQHVVHDSWRKFDTPLKRRADFDFENLPASDEFGMKLKQVADEIKSPRIQAMLDAQKP